MENKVTHIKIIFHSDEVIYFADISYKVASGFLTIEKGLCDRNGLFINRNINTDLISSFETIEEDLANYEYHSRHEITYLFD